MASPKNGPGSPSVVGPHLNLAADSSIESFDVCSFEQTLLNGENYFNWGACTCTLTKQEGSIDDRVKNLIKNIDSIIQEIKDKKRNLESFEIGSVGVSQFSGGRPSFNPMKHNTWDKAEIEKLWDYYKGKQYDILIILSVVTNDAVPKGIGQGEYADMLQETLYNHYRFENSNTCEQIIKDTPKTRNTATCLKGYAVYVAIKLEKCEEEDCTPPAPKKKKT